jgi:hypothetical protein
MTGEKENFQKYEIGGAICAMIGFFLVVFGSSVFLKLISSVSSTTADYLLLGGLVMLIMGFGFLGYGWAGGWSTPGTDGKRVSLIPSPRMSIVLTLIATTVIAVIAVWADSTENLLWTAVTVGAIGGLVHEIAQSKGTAFFPDTDNPQQNKNESYLGGLLGILLGGAAGLVALSVSSAPTSVSIQMIATAFAAGVALKGIADSAASPPNTGSSANPSS